MSEKLDVNTVARKLIELVGGDDKESNIKGVEEVLSSMVQGINLNWEMFIAEETDDILAEDNTCCSNCGAQIVVVRERKVVYVEQC